MTVTESVTGRLLLDRLKAAGIATHDWWPEDVHTPLRRLIAGVLVQRTTATNAYLALRNLDRAGLLISSEVLLSAPLERVTELVLSAGFIRLSRVACEELFNGGPTTRPTTFE